MGHHFPGISWHFAPIPNHSLRFASLRLRQVVSTMAGSVASALTDRTIAELVKHSTDTIQVGLSPVEHGKSMENPWKIHGKSMENMEKPWKIHGKSHNMNDSWGILGVIR